MANSKGQEARGKGQGAGGKGQGANGKGQLEALTRAPVLDLIIRYDGRTGQVGVMCVGGQIDTGGVYQLLEMARGWVRTQEIEAARRQGENGKAGAEPPA